MTRRPTLVFQRLFAFSRPIGFRFCGIIEEPTCSSSNGSPTSPISVRCRCLRLSERSARIPCAMVISTIRRIIGSGGAICVECSAGLRPRIARISRSNSSGSSKKSEEAL